MPELKLNRNTQTQTEAKSNLFSSSRTFRERCEVFFQLLNRRSVPLLIFSAGLGDVIEETIKLQSRMYNNMKIVSNYMDFNHQVSGTSVSYWDTSHYSIFVSWMSVFLRITCVGVSRWNRSSLICMRSQGLCLKVTAVHRSTPDQGEGCSHAKVIASYIIRCSLTATQLYDRQLANSHCDQCDLHSTFSE